MVEIIQLPVLYAVEGALRGKRKALLHRVVELVSFEIAGMEEGERFSVGRYAPTVVDGRPWIPVVARDPKGMTPSQASAIGAMYATRSLPRAWTAKRETKAIWGRPWRGLDYEEGPVVVGVAQDWRSEFARIEGSDRADALDVSKRLAGHLRVLDGRLHTDRYEPLIRDFRSRDSARNDLDIHGEYKVYYDVVTGALCIPTSATAQETKDMPMRMVPSGTVADPGEPHRAAPWAAGVEWEVDRSTLVALGLSNAFAAELDLHPRHRPSPVSSLGHAGEGAFASILGWGRERLAGRAAVLDEAAFRFDMETMRAAIASADGLGARSFLSTLGMCLDRAEKSFASLARGPGHPEPSAEEDLVALQGMSDRYAAPRGPVP